MVNIIKSLFPTFFFQKNSFIFRWFLVIHLLFLISENVQLHNFSNFHKKAKSLWDRLPYFYKQFLETRKIGLFQMPALFVYKNDFA